MHHRTLRLLVLIGLATVPAVRADYLMTASGTLTLSGAGPNSLGLDGAQFTLTAYFPEGIYANEAGYPVAVGDPSRSSLQISGATNPDYNGLFSHFTGYTPPLWYPTTGSVAGGEADIYFLYFDLGINEAFVGLGLDSDPTPSGLGVNVGDAIQLADFSSGEAILPRTVSNETYFGAGFGDLFDSNYDISNGVITTTVVPEPSVLVLGGLGMLAGLRRRR